MPLNDADIEWDEPQATSLSHENIQWDETPSPAIEEPIDISQQIRARMAEEESRPMRGVEALKKGVTQFIPDIARMGVGTVAALSPYGLEEGWRVPPLAKGLGQLATGNKELWSALSEDYKRKYGSYEGFLQAIAERPAEVMADISVVGGLAGKAAKVSGLAKTGAALTKAGTAIDPFRLAVKPVAATLRKGKELMGRIPISKEAAAAGVGRELVATLETGEPVFAKNMAEAQALQAKFPGLKFTYAQATDLPSAIAKEKALVATTKAGKIAKGMQQAKADTAIAGRLEKVFKGSEGIEDVTGEIGKQQRVGARGREVAEISSKRAAEALARGRMMPEEAGATLLERAKAAKGIEKVKFEEKFGKLDPTIPAPAHPLESKLATVQNKYTQQVPESIKKMIEGAVGDDGKISYGNLRKIRSRVAQEQRFAGTPDKAELSAVLTELKQGVDATLGQFAKKSIAGEQAGLYAKTISEYRREYVPKFRQGATAKILSWKRTGDQVVDDAMIAGEYFKSGNQGIRAAQDFKTTFGSDKVATKALKDYAIQDLLKAAKNDATGEISTSAMQSWIHKNRPAIAAHGLWDEFKDFRKTRQALEKAKEVEDKFNKGYAAQILGVDAEKAIANIIGKGKRDSVMAAHDVVSKIRKLKETDPTAATSAMKGLHNATKDYIMQKVNTTMPDLAGQPQLSGAAMARMMDELDPALKVIYRDAPSKLTALRETRQVLDTLRRAERNLPGGSETVMFATESIPLMRRIVGHIPGVGIAEALYGLAKKYSKTQMDDIMVNAYFNPEYAETLMNLAKKKITAAQFEEKIGKIVTPMAVATDISTLSDDELNAILRRKE